MTLDWKHWTAIGLLLAALIAWGSRESLHIKESQATSKTVLALQEEKKTLQTSKAELETQMKSDSEETEELIPMQFPDGTVAMITRRSKRTLQEAISKAKSESSTQILELTKRNETLEAKLKTFEKDQVKSSPRWMTGLDWKPMSQGAEALAPRLGMNFGPLSIYASHAISSQLEPHAGIDLRY